MTPTGNEQTPCPEKRALLGAGIDVRTAADLCRRSECLAFDVPIEDVFHLFESQPDLINVPVVQGDRIVGMINRDRLMHTMAKPFHRELYGKKPCMQVVDETPVVVASGTPIHELGSLLLGKSDARHLCSGFIVELDHKPIGTGLISDVLAALLVQERELAEELVRVNEKLIRLTITDALTGLYNRRHFNEVVEIELARAHREAKSLGLMVLDVDHFKKLNDTRGHQAGDEALQEIGRVLGECLRRPSDHAFRIGGEEFAVLTTDASRASAEAMGERIRGRIAELRIRNPAHPLGIVTVSVGATFSRPRGEDARALYHRADLALYQAKEGGRDRVVVLDDCAER